MSTMESAAGRSCKNCSEEDNSQMVCCDSCNEWYHFRCVGVTAAIANVDWSCAGCTASPTCTPTARPQAEAGAASTRTTATTEARNALRSEAVAEAPASIHFAGRGRSVTARRLHAEKQLLDEEEQLLRQREALLKRRRDLLLQTEECSDTEYELDEIAVQQWLQGTEITMAPNLAPRTAEHKVQSYPPAVPADSSYVQQQLTSVLAKLEILEQQANSKSNPPPTGLRLPSGSQGFPPTCGAAPTRDESAACPASTGLRLPSGSQGFPPTCGAAPTRDESAACPASTGLRLPSGSQGFPPTCGAAPTRDESAACPASTGLRLPSGSQGSPPTCGAAPTRGESASCPAPTGLWLPDGFQGCPPTCGAAPTYNQSASCRAPTGLWLPSGFQGSPPTCGTAPTRTEPAFTPSITHRLTSDQLAARSGITKELPTFDGRPEEWPLFLATYQQTTEMCGFSEGENLARLRQALTGAARNAVKNLLLHSSCVPQVLDTLRMKFGRPELIISVLLNRIRELPPLKENRLETLVDFALEVQTICATMKASDMTNYLNSPELEQQLVGKLPGLLAAFWGMHKLQLPSHNLENFGLWLFQLAQGANHVIVPVGSTKPVPKRGVLNAHTSNTSREGGGRCVICDGPCVAVESCNNFRIADRHKRWKLVRRHNLCRCCLKPHFPSPCTSNTTCGIDDCAFNHHPLLHKRPSSGINTPKSGVICSTHSNGVDSILFRVLPVTLYGNGTRLETYAFFDDGSSLTLMDAELQDRLKLRGVPQPLCLRWTANTHRYEDDSQILDLGISGDNPNKRFALKNVRTVSKLNLPSQTLDVKELQARYVHLRGLPLASYTGAMPKLLIGLNNSGLGLALRSREGASNAPVAEKTRLGWTVKGLLLNRGQRLDSGYHAFHACDCDAASHGELLRVVKEFICLDNSDVERKADALLSTDDRQAIEQLKGITKRFDGRFETGLLWRCQKPTHPNSFPLALRRARCLQHKLMRDPVLAESLTMKIGSYINKRYAKRLDAASLAEKKCWYLPIFPVYNPHKPGKIRLVWDAAAKTDGVSLNSMLLKGPDQLTSLVSILRRFRQRAVAVSGDIEEMFHQIRIRTDDQNYQRFLWFEPGATEPTVFAMTVMTFGATCSPSCAQYVKNLNASEFRARYPRAVESIIDNHYVDDMLDSVDTEEEAIRLAADVKLIHAQGGFNIRNWRSNSSKVLRALGATTTDLQKSFCSNPEANAAKILGLWWLTEEDCFTFRVATHHKNNELLQNNRCPTKREVLSVVMSIFDPLGLLDFYVIYAKIILQEIWRSGCDWNENIHDEQHRNWIRWVQLLPEIETIKIPRCYFTDLGANSELEMHTFVDASINAYAAVCYLRHTVKGKADCILIGSKAKVAPLKMLSIPRLELQAALIGARLAASMRSSHTLPIKNRTFWTDSRTVLSWIRSDHRRYSQFVAFRVSEIVELTETSEWRWVPSAANVADDATKWQSSPDLSSQSRWYHGPSFLKEERSKWPSEPEGDNSTKEELKAQHLGLHHEINQTLLATTIERFSRWPRLLRVVATVVQTARYWKSFRQDAGMIRGLPCQEDFQRAEKLIWREAQRAAFADEIASLARGKPISRSSSIYTLTPYLDNDYLLRLGGRLNLEGARDLIILPKSHHVTRLIVLDYHIKHIHGYSEAVVNELRRVFWIPNLRAVVNKTRRACQTCLNRSARPRPPRMAALPPPRLAPFIRPFSYVGVDYFGPMLVAVRRSSEKRYGVLLTCLTTRAVHLEVAYSLSADSCILAIRGFMARRGIPLEFWSDNGTNFRATERELREAFDIMDRNKVINTFTSSTMRWQFIPPASPHMGGSWERLVRSVKDVLFRILSSQRPSDELLRGALMEVEATINSRPLTYLPIGSEDDEALTPNHFLLGSSNGLKPLVEFVDGAVQLRHSWRSAQQLADAFWRRWIREYLPTITRRTKWFDRVKPIEIGDVVYIVDPNGPRNCWPKGRVVAVKRARDGQARSATVQTSAGLFERPAARLAVLSVGEVQC